MSDYERFGIDPQSPLADVTLEVARHLVARGHDPDEVKEAGGWDGVHMLAWRRIFGIAGAHLTIAEAAKEAGLSEDQAGRIVAAFGFSDVRPDDPLLSEDDVEMLRLFSGASLLFGEEHAIHLARVIGSAVGRIAEAAAASFRVNVENPIREAGSYEEFLRTAEEVVPGLMDGMGRAMDRLFRFEILRISTQNWSIDPGRTAVVTTAAVGFADIVGFTAHSSALSASELASVIDRFEGRVTQIVGSAGGRVVKFIGDEVLFTFADATSACRCAVDLLDLASAESFPDVRVGIAFGQVITRYGDLYGPIVNLAARLVEVAPARGVLVTPEVAERAAHAYTFEPQAPVAVKGIERRVDNLLLR